MTQMAADEAKKAIDLAHIELMSDADYERSYELAAGGDEISALAIRIDHAAARAQAVRNGEREAALKAEVKRLEEEFEDDSWRCEQCGRVYNDLRDAKVYSEDGDQWCDGCVATWEWHCPHGCWHSKAPGQCGECGAPLSWAPKETKE